MLEAAGVALAGMVVYLDTTAIGQFMICQPLIACPLWGLIVGRPEIGLFFGVAFQLIGLGSLPVGAAKFPEINVGALVATALATRIPPVPDGSPAWLVLTLAAVVGVLTAQAGAEITPQVRRILNRFAERVVEAARAGARGRFMRLFLGAIGIHALAGLLLSGIAFLIGKAVFAFYLGDFAVAGISPALRAQTDIILAALWPALLGAGVAVIAARFVRRASIKWFLLAAMICIVGGWLWL
jgi:mannose/fructose/N-acetylgalactosamine-specific phosphotransferase system component IIC